MKYLQMNPTEMFSNQLDGPLAPHLVPEAIRAQDEEAVLGSELVVQNLRGGIQVRWGQIVGWRVVVHVERVQVHARLQTLQNAALKLPAPLEAHVAKSTQGH